MPHPHLHLAIRTVADSCRVARNVQSRLDEMRSLTKDDRSPVTVADFAVQAIVALDLLEADGSTLIVGEERADLLRQDDQQSVRAAVVDAVWTVRPDVTEDQVLAAIDHCGHDGSADAYWTLDPIDGTKGFLRGQQYAIALGYLEGGTVRLGVLGCPNLPTDQQAPLDVADAEGSMYAAVLGAGAWGIAGTDANGEREPLAAAAYEADGRMRTCESVEAAHSKHSDAARILETLGVTSDPVRLDSQCKYAVVARGQADAYLRLPTRKGYIEKTWDHAAGSLVATEAGATVSDMSGAPLDFTHGALLERNLGVICAAASLHPDVIRAIETLGIGVPV